MTARQAEISRNTKETAIELSLSLDGAGAAEVQTGIGFYDHMLGHIAHHGKFDLRVRAQGDLHIDAHHTVEDIAICLGRAIDQALGSRVGIQRMGAAYVPMDEALARVVIDLSGRPYAVISADFKTPLSAIGMSRITGAGWLPRMAVARAVSGSERESPSVAGDSPASSSIDTCTRFESCAAVSAATPESPGPCSRAIWALISVTSAASVATRC